MAVGLYSGVSGLALGIGLYRNVSGLWGGASGLIDGFGGADPYAGASLYLNFLDPTLDSRITFSRGTNATLIDSTGKLTYAPNNLLTWSEDFTNAAWVVNGSPVITANQVIAPDGTMTADTMAVSGASNGFGVYRGGVSPGTYASSLYFKLMSGAFSLRVGLTNNFSVINCSTLAITNTGTGVGSVSAVGNGWYRFVSVGTISASSASEFYNIGSNTGTLAIWGAQLEAVTYQTTPSAYVATTASAYYGPRFDYDPVTLAPRGLLIEEARTNLLTYSEQFDQGIWAKGNSSITVNATASPDGTNNADKLIDNAVNTTHSVIQSFTSTSGTSYTFTVYAKAAELIWIAVQFNSSMFADGLSRTAYINLSTGAVGTVSNAPTVSVSNAGNGWRRVSITATATVSTASASAFVYLANADNGAVYTGTGTSGVYLYGAQLEAGSFATSYIPTVASTVTRNADVATMTGTNFSSWYNQSQGTFVAEGSVASNVDSGTGNYYYSASDGTISNMILSAEVNGTVSQVITGGVVQFNETVGGEPTGVLKVAVAYQANNTVSSANGAIGTTDTSVTLPTVDRLSIGARGDLSATSYLSGHIRTIAYFNTRLPNTQLQTLTAPSLATTLSLDFTSGSYNVGF